MRDLNLGRNDAVCYARNDAVLGVDEVQQYHQNRVSTYTLLKKL